MRRLAWLAILILISVAGVGQESPAARTGPIFGTFSSLRMHPETGDVLGAELTVLPQYQKAYVIFQCAEGEPTAPVFVAGDLKGNTIQFTIKQTNNPCSGKYSATVSKDGVKLSSDISAGNVEFLPRRRSYWVQ